jgi:isochorismate synthase
VLNDNSNLKQVISVLHPTPTVCGLLNKKQDFILENEGYDRKYYTGFLGELNKAFNKETLKSDLYVKCMKIKDNQAHFIWVCGITKDSNPGKSGRRASTNP